MNKHKARKETAPSWPATSQQTLDKSFHFPESQSPHLEQGKFPSTLPLQNSVGYLHSLESLLQSCLSNEAWAPIFNTATHPS